MALVGGEDADATLDLKCLVHELEVMFVTNMSKPKRGSSHGRNWLFQEYEQEQ